MCVWVCVYTYIYMLWEFSHVGLAPLSLSLWGCLICRLPVIYLIVSHSAFACRCYIYMCVCAFARAPTRLKESSSRVLDVCGELLGPKNSGTTFQSNLDRNAQTRWNMIHEGELTLFSTEYGNTSSIILIAKFEHLNTTMHCFLSPKLTEPQARTCCTDTLVIKWHLQEI